MKNKHPAKCTGCGEPVGPGDGHLEKIRGGWRVFHTNCKPVIVKRK